MLAILQLVQEGRISIEEAAVRLRRVELDLLDSRARLDIGRTTRRGLPEVVLASNKGTSDAARLVTTAAHEQGQGLISRLSDEHQTVLEEMSASLGLELQAYARSARVVRPGFVPPVRCARVGLLTAGTSDLAVIEEVRMMTDACGIECRLVSDVGVAGLHRLFQPLADLLDWRPDVLVVAAGMDGVLPGVVSGLVHLPVIGVPVSNGYGAGGKGKAALLTMLQSCATGLLTMNIDNGIGAGAAAVLIASQVAGARTPTDESVPAGTA